MFSIIIPLYNKAAYVVKAIQSVLTQTYQEFEIIVVNDGSTDNSLEVVTAFQLSTFNYQLLTQKNSGVSVARNNGVKQAKFPYICFLDADDWWEPTFLEEMKCLIEEYPNVGIYGSNYYIVKNKHKKICNIGLESSFEKGFINYFQVYAKTLKMPLWTGAVVIKKVIFEEENGFKPQLKLGEDFDLWVRIALKHKIAFANKLLSNYNQDVESISRGVVQDKIYSPETHFVFNLDFLCEEEMKNKELKLLLDKLRLYTLMRYRIQNAFPSFYKKEINKVDFKNQSLSLWLTYYILPPVILRIWQKSKRMIGKKVKNILK